MARFQYSAFAANGRKISGTVEAADIVDARRRAQAPGVMITDVRPLVGIRRSSFFRFPKFADRFDQVGFFSNLAVLSTAGLTLDQSLRALRAAASRRSERDRLEAMTERLSGGNSAASTLALIDGIGADVLALIASGEKTARLAAVLPAIASDLERRRDQRKQLLDTLLYPAFLLVMMVIALGVVTFVLVPALEPVFDGSGRPLPFLIAVLSFAGKMLSDPSVVATGIGAILILAILSIAQAKAIAGLASAALLKMPVLGSLMIKVALARYLQTLSLLLDNAVAMPEALSLAADACTIASYRQKLTAMREKVISGRRLGEAFADSRLFPASIVSLAVVGDEVNRLAPVLANGSNILRHEAERTLDRLLALLTPGITILLGTLVGGLVISVMTALLSVNELGVQ